MLMIQNVSLSVFKMFLCLNADFEDLKESSLTLSVSLTDSICYIDDSNCFLLCLSLSE